MCALPQNGLGKEQQISFVSAHCREQRDPLYIFDKTDKKIENYMCFSLLKNFLHMNVVCICAEISARRRVRQMQAKNVLVTKLRTPRRRNFRRLESRANTGGKRSCNKITCA